MQGSGRLVPTGFGLLLFGREPRIVLPQAGLLGTIHYPDGTEETRDFDGPMVLIPGQVEQWLIDKLPNTIDRRRMHRGKTPPVSFELVREAVVNGLIHRDYDIAGAKCQLTVTDDTITVRSPGGPVPPVTLQKLQAFEAPMLSRNPEVHFVFARMDLAEERGLGMKTLKSASWRFGLPLPKYSLEEPYLVLTLYRSPESATRALPPDVVKKLSADDIAAWQFVVARDSVASSDLQEYLRFDERKAQRVLRKFVSANLLHQIGKGRATRYTVVRP
jgi:ATP-dependent DNA helicase RecG